MGNKYLYYFHDFIQDNLPRDEDTFTPKQMDSWVRNSSNKYPEEIIEHLLKRTTNYLCRDDNKPKSKPEDDLFFIEDLPSINPYLLSLRL